MRLKSYWRQDGTSSIISEDELIERLSSLKTGVVFLSTVPSSDGEMRVVQKLAGRRDTKVFYCRELVEELIKIILNNPQDCLATDVLCEKLKQHQVIIIRFANWSYGLAATIESLSQICAKLSNNSLVTVTGDDLDYYVPDLLQLSNATQYYICH